MKKRRAHQAQSFLRIPPFIVLILSLFLTAGAGYYAYVQAASEAAIRKDILARRMARAVEQRLHVYLNTLVHVRSLLISDPQVSRSQFSKFVTHLDLQNQYPGIQGIAEVLVLPKSNLNQFLNQARKEGASGFQVWPVTDKKTIYPVAMIEPANERNSKVLGFDMSSDPTRMQAMSQATDSGEATLSKSLILKQEAQTQQQVGFLLFLPIYKASAPTETIEQRRQALIGFVASPFRVNDLFGEIWSEENKQNEYAGLEVFEGSEIQAGNLLYSPVSTREHLNDEFRKISLNPVSIHFGGKIWTVTAIPVQNLQPSFWSYIPWGFLIFGTLVSLLIYILFRKAVALNQTLLKSDSHIRLITDALPILIAYIDREGRYTFVNQAYENWFQKPVEDLLGQISYESQQVPYHQYFLDVLKGNSVQFEADMTHPVLGARKVAHRYIPDLRPDGSVVGFFNSGTDVTAERSIQNQLRDETKLTEKISEVGLQLTGELSLDKLVQNLTDSATEMIGAELGAFFYTVQKSSGESMTLYSISGASKEAFAKFPMPRNTAIFGPTLKNQKIVRFDDVTKASTYGHNKPYHGMPTGHLPVKSYLAVPVVSRSGEVHGGLFFGHAEAGVFTERTEKLIAGIASQAAVAFDNATLYAQAQAANRMKDEFLATLSHELRTPLNVIIGFSEILQTENLDNSEAKEAVEAIHRNATSQNQIVNDLLDISSMISGKIKIHPSVLNVVGLVRSTLEGHRVVLQDKRLQIHFQHSHSEIPISGDPVRLQQVIWNLLSNAIKFTPAGGNIWVSVEASAGVSGKQKCEITVRDDGSGIDEKFLPHVFDRFRQEDSSFSRNYGGLGLGLSIVKTLIEMHGGSIEVRSSGKNQGSQFIVTLPVLESTADINRDAREEGVSKESSH